MEIQREKSGKMNDIHISFYLRAGRIHIFVEALRCIGCPERICFMIAADGQSLLMRAYERRDLKSHKVPRNVYNGRRSLEISSCKLCGILAGLLKCSYRVPGIIMKDQRSVLFPLTKAEVTSKKAGNHL